MFSTINSVKLYTGQDLTLELIQRAQAIVEIYIGKDEVDVENASDLLLLDKMTAYQAAYMEENESVIFKQIAINSGGSGDAVVNFNDKLSAPFIAPLTAIASKGLSFNKSRSYRTGKIFQRRATIDMTTNLDWREI